MVSKSYMTPETPVVWTDSGGDKLMDMGGVVSLGRRMGAYLDRGTGSQPMMYEVEIKIDGMQTTPVVGESFTISVSQSDDSTNWDGAPSTAPTDTTEGTIDLGGFRMCKVIGHLYISAADTGAVHQARFITRIDKRYISPLIQNNTLDTTNATGDAHTLTFTPIPQDAQ